jgi:hypothetical protein
MVERGCRLRAHSCARKSSFYYPLLKPARTDTNLNGYYAEMPNGVLVAVSWARNPIWCVLPDLIHFRSDSFWTAASNLETVEGAIGGWMSTEALFYHSARKVVTHQWCEVAGVPKPKIQSLFQQTLESRYHWVQFNGVYLCRLLVSQNSIWSFFLFWYLSEILLVFICEEGA